MAIDHIGRQVKVEALGQTWTFSRWSRRVWVDFTAYAMTMIPNPLKLANEVLPAWSLADADTMRGLLKADIEDEKTAAKEGRSPITVADKFRPNSEILVEKAIAKSSLYLGFGSPEMDSFMNSIPGMSWLFFMLLQKHHPDIDDETAYDVMMDMSAKDKARVMAVTGGKVDSQPKNESGQAA